MVIAETNKQNVNDLPLKFNETAVFPKTKPPLTEREDGEYEAVDNDNHVEISLLNFGENTWNASYNIAPTNTAIIIYCSKVDDSLISHHYNIELLKFGLLPVWAKPQDSTPVKNGLPYSREVQKHQSKYFNCRKESLAQNQLVWTSARKHTRCVVPIQGYFEWQKSDGDKTPYYVHSLKQPLLYLAALYSHNHNYNDTGLVPNSQPYFSSFTIVTGPGTGKGDNDLSWLHSRKPVLLEPNTKEWFDWLDPEKEWASSLLDTCLDTDNNPAYKNIVSYTVTKDVGKPANKSEQMIKEVKKTQKSIHLFFSPRKRKAEDEHSAKRVKTNPETDSKAYVKKEEPKKVKKETDTDVKEEKGTNVKKEKD